MEYINWDRSMLERFKKEYKRQPGDSHAVFTFDGHDFVKGYAKFLIEFLEGRLAEGR